MTDEAGKSPLALKALAQKAAREKAAADADAQITGARTKRQVLSEIWTVVRLQYLTATQAISQDLAGTGTSLRINAPDEAPLHLVGSLSISVARADDPKDIQTHSVELVNSGTYNFKDSFEPGRKPEDHFFDAEHAGTDWVEPTLRAFVDRALS